MTVLREVLVLSVLIVLFIGSGAGLAIGVGLLLRAQATLAFFSRANRWVSSGMDVTARQDRPVRGPASLTDGQRRFAGAVFALGGAGAALFLAVGGNLPTLVAARGAAWVMSMVLADAIRWFLVIGCTGAAAIGVLLLFFPRGWVALEARANRWCSTQTFFAQADAMHSPIDRWIERSPRPAGVVIAVLSAISVTTFGVLLFSHLY